MFGTIINSWALFSGFGLIMLAHALQGTLLNINAVFYNFSDFEIGYVFTGYFVGYLWKAKTNPINAPKSSSSTTGSSGMRERLMKLPHECFPL